MNAELLAVLRALINRRRFIMAFTGAAFMLAAAAHITLNAPSYEAEVQLFISSPTLGDVQAAKFIPEVHHVRTYEELMQSAAVIGDVYGVLEKEGTWPAEEDKPKFDQFRKQLKLRTTVLDQTTRPVNYAPLVTLQAKAKSEELAKAYADAWARVAVQHARRALDVGLQAAEAVVAQQEQDFEDDLSATWDAYAEEQAEHNIIVLTSELENTVALLAKVQNSLVDMERQRDASRQQVALAQEELDGETPILDLFFSPSDDVFWQLVADGGEPGELKEKGMIHQAVNEVYVTLRSSQAQAALAMVEAEASIDTLKKQIADLEAEKMRIQERLAVHDRSQKELQLKANTWQEIYTDLAISRSYVNVAAKLSSADDDASTQPLGVNRIGSEIYAYEAGELLPGSVRVLFATMLGFAIACVYVAGTALAPFYVSAMNDTSGKPAA